MAATAPLVIDVREPEEFVGELGHIEGSILVPMDALEHRLPKLVGYVDREVIVVCRAGAHSASAAAILQHAGFKHVTNLDGGMLSWARASLPVQREHALDQLVPRDDVGRCPDLEPTCDARLVVARAAYQSWRRVHDHSLPLQSLDHDESPETAAFARWCRRFQHVLGDCDWEDGALAQSQVHAVAAARGLEIVGFDRLTPLLESLLARWAAAGIEVRRTALATASPSVQRVDCLDGTAEIDAAARWVSAGASASEEPKVSGFASVDVMSNYVWRGIKVSNSWVLQPSVGIGYGGFAANIWGNI